MRRYCSSWISGFACHLVWLVLVCSWSWTWRIAAAQAQQSPKTDPLEMTALNTILGRWGKTASSEWNISGEPCSGLAADKNDWDYYPNINPFIKCDCSFSNNTVCHIIKLRVVNFSVVGQIPSELQNFTYMQDLNLGYNYLTGALPSFFGKALPFNALSGPLPKELGNLTNLLSLGISFNNYSGQLPEELGNMTNLQQMRASDNEFTGKIPDYLGSMPNLEDIRIGDIVNGSSSLSFISNFTSLSNLILRNCKISGNLGPVDFSKFAALILLFLGNNSLTGSLPDAISPSLNTIDFSYNQLTGSLPSWATQNNLQLNLVANNFVLGSTDHSNRSTRGFDGTIYEADAPNLGTASYYVTSETRWGVSNVGNYFLATDGTNIINSLQKFQNAVDSKLFETARMSASSVRYYGLGLENGNYTVLLQFAEFGYPDSQTWVSLGRRVFDIYIQGDLKEKNFDIRKTAGGKSFTAVNRTYTVTVSKNFLEIHLFWAGKGTCCVPIQGYYGPMVSALSVTPNFTPTVRNGVPKRRSKAGVIAGISIGALILGLVALFGIFMIVKKRRTIAQQKEELYNLVGQPDVFSNTELKLATDNFSSHNIIGEAFCNLSVQNIHVTSGKFFLRQGKLPDGRVVAVKQLSETSHQGKGEFVTEVATISAVQHRNLVKLHGCCIDSKTPLLVYEYLENGSLDRAIFGKSSLNLDWAMRFEIILGIARGLTYLHEESSVRIVHRDIKASNVLLDSDFTPKISDFGLAKLYDEKKTHVSTRIAGTLGYLAPEYAMRGHLSEKADIFAFGVVMLETVAGRSNTNNSLEESKIYLLEWAWGMYEMGQTLQVVDPSLEEFDEDEAFRVIRIALLCTQGSPHQRPSMSKVVAMLSGDVDVADVFTKPSYVTEWQLKDGWTSSYTSSSYAGSSNTDFSRQKETNPLTLSPTITKANLEAR
uniref:non-specific serine/threonine protein kinase n=1 Tax=Leersia perrieri TaxID=77586 RepID=A0A0D9WEG7_9ORYZ